MEAPVGEARERWQGGHETTCRYDEPLRLMCAEGRVMISAPSSRKIGSSRA